MEVQQKLNLHRPETLGQAARISGVTPAAISVLLVHLKRGFAQARRKRMTLAADLAAGLRALGVSLRPCGAGEASRLYRAHREMEPCLQPHGRAGARAHARLTTCSIASPCCRTSKGRRSPTWAAARGFRASRSRSRGRTGAWRCSRAITRRRRFCSQAAIELELANVDIREERAEAVLPRAGLRFGHLARFFRPRRVRRGSLAALQARGHRARDERRLSVRGASPRCRQPAVSRKSWRSKCPGWPPSVTSSSCEAN